MSLVYKGEGNGNPLQYSCLENSVDGGAWLATVHGVAKSQTWLSDFTFFLSIVLFGGRNGNPLQCSCLENPMDGGAWWASLWGCKESDKIKQLTHSLVYKSLLNELAWLVEQGMLLLLGRFSHVRLCAIPQTAAHQTLPSLGFSRQEHWSGVPFEQSISVNKNGHLKIYDRWWEIGVWPRKLKQGLCINLEGWDGEGFARKVWEGGDMGVPMADSCWCLTKTTKSCKAIILQLKNK